MQESLNDAIAYKRLGTHLTQITTLEGDKESSRSHLMHKNSEDSEKFSVFCASCKANWERNHGSLGMRDLFVATV